MKTLAYSIKKFITFINQHLVRLSLKKAITARMLLLGNGI